MEMITLQWIVHACSLVDLRIYNLDPDEEFWRGAIIVQSLSDRLPFLLIHGVMDIGGWKTVMPIRALFPCLCTLELCTPMPLQPFVGLFPPSLHTLILHAPISPEVITNGRASVLNWALPDALSNGLFANAKAKVALVVKTDCNNPFGWDLALAAAQRYRVDLKKWAFTHNGMVAAIVAGHPNEPWPLEVN
jgi:hypothetical protein